jgi:hypothetical protein
MLRTFIEFFVINQRGTKQNWQATLALNERLRDHIASEGHDPEFVERMIEQMPFREKLWIRSAESWKLLCHGALSDDSLNEWAWSSA